MKKRVYFVLLSLLVFSSFFVSAADSNLTDSKAYACLESRVNNKCSSLSTEEKIFSFLAINKCKSEVLLDQASAGCWPKENCNIKTTSQAVLALRNSGEPTITAEDWLLTQSIPSPNVEWFLQIEPVEESSCTITYTENSYTVKVSDTKELNRNAGSCLSVYDDYWFKVSSSCYNQDFRISCDKSFVTSLIYKKKSSQTRHDFYIPNKVNSAPASGTTIEKVKSSCFSSTTLCNYEDTLWATTVLYYLGKDISEYLPYLITMMEDNSKYLPESFLYSLTGEFDIDLLAKQIDSKYWLASGDKFYDTAVALLPFQDKSSLMEKTNAKAWLREVQGNDGCWQNNIQTTSFLLYSVWGNKVTPVVSLPNCENAGYFCVSAASCSSTNGRVLANYSGCLGSSLVCCSTDDELKSCADRGGDLCSSGEVCNGGVAVESSDSTSSAICCARGACGAQTEEEETNSCEDNNGVCKEYCADGETSSSDSCSSSDVCCMKKEGSSWWVILVLILLIVAVVAGIIFKDKLRQLLLRFKPRPKSGGKPQTQGSPRFPPSSSSEVYPGAVQRRVMPYREPTSRRPIQRKNEVDEVLKKLKDMSK